MGREAREIHRLQEKFFEYGILIIFPTAFALADYRENDNSTVCKHLVNYSLVLSSHAI
jgi:hypothetical protein